MIGNVSQLFLFVSPNTFIRHTLLIFLYLLIYVKKVCLILSEWPRYSYINRDGQTRIDFPCLSLSLSNKEVNTRGGESTRDMSMWRHLSPDDIPQEDANMSMNDTVVLLLGKSLGPASLSMGMDRYQPFWTSLEEQEGMKYFLFWFSVAC